MQRIKPIGSLGYRVRRFVIITTTEYDLISLGSRADQDLLLIDIRSGQDRDRA